MTELEPDDLILRIVRGEPTGDPVADAAFGALIATGMTPRGIVAVLRELACAARMVRTA